MTKKKTVSVEKEEQKTPEVVQSVEVETVESKSPKNEPSFRIVTGSYEHNLLCLSLSLRKNKKGETTELFTPIFHFTPHTQSIRSVTAGKRFLFSGSNDEHIRVYDLKLRKELGTIDEHQGSVTAMKFYLDKWLITGGGDGKLYIFNKSKDWEDMRELKGHKGEINAISIHPSGKLGLTAGADKTLRLWNLMTGREASKFKFRQIPFKCNWSPEGSHFIVGFDNSIVIYSAESANVVHEIDLKRQMMQHMDIITIKDKAYLATSHSNGKVRIQELDPLLEGKEPEDSFELQAHAVRVKSFSTLKCEDNNVDYMTTVSSDGKIVIHDLHARDQIAVYETGDRLNCCVMIPETVEDITAVKNRQMQAALADKGAETDFSASESDAETVQQPPKKKSKKNKKNKGKITVDLE